MSKAGPLVGSSPGRANRTGTTTDFHDRIIPSTDASLYVEPRSLPRGDLGPGMHFDERVIGLALGSPGQSPLPLLPPDDRDVNISQNVDFSHNSTSPEKMPGALGTVTEIGAVKQGIERKGSKWRIIGSFFGRKDSPARAPEATSFFQLDKSAQQGSAKQDNSLDYSDTNVLRRKRADSNRSNRTRTGLSNSTTKVDSSGLLRRNSSRMKVLRRRKGVEGINPERPRLHNALSMHAEVEDVQPPPLVPPTDLRRPIRPLLQVEIPNVELERYSVMFGDVLETKPQAKSEPGKQLSVLARRQGQVGELLQLVPNTKSPHSSLAEDLPQPPHRRQNSTSSRSTKSPSFSLFPSSTPTLRQPANSTASKTLAKSSPLSRSTTAPNILAPPSRPQIRKSKSQDQGHVFVIVHGPEDPPLTRGRSLDVPYPSASPTPTSFFGYPDFSPNSHPTTEVYPPTPITGVARQAVLKRSFPARKSSMKKLHLPLEEPRFPSHTRSDSGSTTAEVSIARQISISRRQRQLLIPIAPKLARQPRQPKLVNGVSTPAARKSHHLTLEDA